MQCGLGLTYNYSHALTFTNSPFYKNLILFFKKPIMNVQLIGLSQHYPMYPLKSWVDNISNKAIYENGV
eukprot:snap_masked-scaffold_5-processed-gene-5.20-mRNA-1 protein AED:1.00 eAED:1.00 QI:0/0/0/0/1/1/3/0/68